MGIFLQSLVPLQSMKGLIEVTGEKAEVKILNTNTNKLIVAEVEIENGQAKARRGYLYFRSA